MISVSLWKQLQSVIKCNKIRFLQNIIILLFLAQCTVLFTNLRYQCYRILKLQEEKDEDEMYLALTALAKRKKKRRHRWWVHDLLTKRNHLWIVPPPGAGTLTRRGQISFIFSDDKRTIFRNVVLRGTCTTKNVFAMGISRPRRHYNNPTPYTRCAW